MTTTALDTIMQSTCEAFGITPELFFLNVRWNGGLTTSIKWRGHASAELLDAYGIAGRSPRITDARAAFILTVYRSGGNSGHIRRYFASNGLRRSKDSIFNLRDSAKQAERTDKRFRECFEKIVSCKSHEKDET
jgi:hypothetical protein